MTFRIHIRLTLISGYHISAPPQPAS